MTPSDESNSERWWTCIAEYEDANAKIWGAVFQEFQRTAAEAAAALQEIELMEGFTRRTIYVFPQDVGERFDWGGS
jgi:hypothetical protein